MKLSQVLMLVANAGVSLSVVDGTLRYEAFPEKMTAELKEAVKQHKNELIELLSTLGSDPERSPFASIIGQARGGQLQATGFILSDFQVVSNPNVYVIYALGQIQSNTHHRMACITGLALLAEAYAKLEQELAAL